MHKYKADSNICTSMRRTVMYASKYEADSANTSTSIRQIVIQAQLYYTSLATFALSLNTLHKYNCMTNISYFYVTF